MRNVVIVFSPTGSTKRVADIVAGRWGGADVEIDLSDPEADFSRCHVEADDRVLVAMPSFGGRAPAVAVERLAHIAGHGASCTLVCVYGNRAYEDTLAEMEDAARACGLRVIAAIAAVAEHSIIARYATGRPDEADARRLAEYADLIAEKDAALSSAPAASKAVGDAVADDAAAPIPGNRPYKKAGGAALVPRPTKDCVRCGLCAKRCPVRAIDAQTFAADSKTCIGCMRCVKGCARHARKVNAAMVAVASLALKAACSEPKECELFI